MTKPTMGRKKTDTKELATLALLIALIILLGLTPLGLIPLGFIYVTILCVPVVIGTLSMNLKNGLILGLSFGLVSFYTAMTKASALVAPLAQSSPILTGIMCILPRLCVPLVAWIVYRWLSKKNDKQSAESASVIFGTLSAAIIGLLIVVVLFLSGAVKLPGSDERFVVTLTSNQLMLFIGCFVALFAITGAFVASFLFSDAFRNVVARHAPSAVAAICGSFTNTVLYLGLMLLFYVMSGFDTAGVLALIGGTALIAGLSEAVLAAILVPPILTAVQKIRR